MPYPDAKYPHPATRQALRFEEGGYTAGIPEGSETKFTLTDAEREAVERAIKTLDGWQQTCGYHSALEDDAATLRGLLERLGGER